MSYLFLRQPVTDQLFSRYNNC